MYRMRQGRERLRSPLELYGDKEATKGEEGVEFPAFEEEEEMLEQCCFRKDCACKLQFPAENDDTWKVGAWTSSVGACNFARGTAGRRKALSTIAGGDSSFESLDIRAAEVLARSIQALESSSSLTSCAVAMTTSSRRWEEGRSKDEKHQQQDWRSRGWESSEGRLTCSKELGTSIDCQRTDHTFDIFRVLKEIINSSDYARKLSTAAKSPEGTIDKISVQDLNVTNVKENVPEKYQLESAAYVRAKSWNESSRKSGLVDDRHVLPKSASTLSNDFDSDVSNVGASGCGTIPGNLESSHVICMKRVDGEGGASGTTGIDVEGSTVATPEKATKTEFTRFLSSKMRPPKVKGSESSRLTIKSKRGFQRKNNFVALQRKTLGSLENSHGAKDPTHVERRTLVLPSKPPKWKGLSTAFSAVRSICHGEGEAGVVDAQARPLLIIAGKCIFRTSAPLDTPRPCTAFRQRKSLVSRAANTYEKDPPPATSGDSIQDTKKSFSDTQSTSTATLPLPTTTDKHPSRLPSADKCRNEALAIRHWPAVVAELDNWISEIVNEWLDTDDHLAPVMNKSLSNPSVTIDRSVISNTIDVCFEERQGLLEPLQDASALELPAQFSGSLPFLHTQLRMPMSAPSKELTELDARIDEAQTVHDLCQILAPISQTVMSSVPGNKVEGSIEISPASVIHEFGTEDIVQDFQRQIHVLEQEIQDLKNSCSKQEQSALFQRLQAFGL